jgi:hypothetical protein
LNPFVERFAPAFEIIVWILDPFAFGFTHAEIENCEPKFVCGNAMFPFAANEKTPQLVPERYVTLVGVPVKPEVKSVTFPEPE